MEFTKTNMFFKSNWKGILFFTIIIFVVTKGCLDDYYIEEKGVITTAIVYYHDYYLLGKNDNRKVSVGYYYVNNKQYKCYLDDVIPIGTTFKIRYNLKKPEEWRSIDE